VNKIATCAVVLGVAAVLMGLATAVRGEEMRTFTSMYYGQSAVDITESPLIPEGAVSFCPHAKYHDSFYKKQAHGWCCDNNDCTCAAVRTGSNGTYLVQTYKNGPWTQSTSSTIIHKDADTPDGGNHACIYRGELRCLFLPRAGG
jgi:hypothetical protein